MKASTYAKRLITYFDGAAQDFAFKGAAHPEEHPGIEKAYKRRRAILERFIGRLENPEPKTKLTGAEYENACLLAKRFWEIHPKEIQDMGLSREEFYRREILNLLERSK